MDKGVRLQQLIQELDMYVIHRATDFDDVVIHSWEVCRPGLRFAGFYDYYDCTRVQIIGKLELTYIMDLSPEWAQKSVDLYFSSGVRFLIIAHDVDLPSLVLNSAMEHNVTLLGTRVSTSDFMARLIICLNRLLAPRTTVHGVLMEIFGEGVLITGESGIGKSESAMALLSRGHRLVADDAIDIVKTSDGKLTGSAPAMIRNFMEVRGIGLIDAGHMFGIRAVKPDQVIDLVVHFEVWDENTKYDRLGVDTQYTQILGVDVPYYVIPVRPGRSLDAILELAAMNNRERKLGYNAAERLVRRHDSVADGNEDYL